MSWKLLSTGLLACLMSELVAAQPGGAPAAAAPAHGPRLAGDLAIWFFILAELLALGVFFAAYAFFGH